MTFLQLKKGEIIEEMKVLKSLTLQDYCTDHVPELVYFSQFSKEKPTGKNRALVKRNMVDIYRSMFSSLDEDDETGKAELEGKFRSALSDDFFELVYLSSLSKKQTNKKFIKFIKRNAIRVYRDLRYYPDRNIGNKEKLIKNLRLLGFDKHLKFDMLENGASMGENIYSVDFDFAVKDVKIPRGYSENGSPYGISEDSYFKFALKGYEVPDKLLTTMKEKISEIRDNLFIFREIFKTIEEGKKKDSTFDDIFSFKNEDFESENFPLKSSG